ncbi:hypothetical protein CR513_35394, partial [Mucuna pruriens]
MGHPKDTLIQGLHATSRRLRMSHRAYCLNRASKDVNSLSKDKILRLEEQGKNTKHEETESLQGPLTRGRLKRPEEELCQEIRFCSPRDASVVLITKKEKMGDSRDNMKSYSPKTRKSVNAKVEAFSRGKRKFGVSMHKSERSCSKSPSSPSNRSHRSHKSEISDRPMRERRHEEEEPRREKRYEKEPQRVRRFEEDPKKDPLDALKCKIPPFVGDKHIESYLEWEMKVD